MTTDVLVIGGGVAGAAAATLLARAGRSVTLLERESAPHDKVCGEFLSAEATLYLNALGLDAEALGARRIDTVRLDSGQRSADVALPFRALSLSRRVLDAALLDRAAAAGGTVRLGCAVQGLSRVDDRWQARLRDGETVIAREVFLATGKHDLRGWPRPSGRQQDLIGLKQYWRLSAEQTRHLQGVVELALFAGGYAGLQLVEDGRANLCLLVLRQRFAELEQSWQRLLDAIGADCPPFAERLAGGEPQGARPFAVYAIPYGHISRAEDGLWRIGDQAAVIPSFSGDGMSMALHSASRAARFLLEGRGAVAFTRAVAADVRLPVGLATGISRMAVMPAARYLGAAATGVPAAVRAIAALTRVPQAALHRAGIGPAT